MRKKIIKFLPIAYFIVLALAILGPLLKPGYVFLLDFVLAPTSYFNFSNYLNGQSLLASLPYNLVVYLLSLLIPAWIIQKIIFFFIFFFSGFAMWRSLPEKLGVGPRLIASTFFVVNPFVYERFTAGHIGVLLSYALLPLVIKAIFTAFEEKTWRQAIWAVFLWTLQIIFSAHYLVITGVCVGVIFLVYLIASLLLHYNCHSEEEHSDDEESLSKLRQRSFAPLRMTESRRVTFSIGILSIFLKLILLLLIFNSFWLVPTFLLHQNPTTEFSNSHFTAYKSSPDQHYGLLTNLAGMYGFWRERTSEGEFVLAKNNLPIWPLFFVIFLISICFGVKNLLKEKKYVYMGSLLVMGALAVVLSVGSQNGFVGSVNNFIFTYIPAFSGLRESQKFISILVFVYSVFIAYGLYCFRSNKLMYYFFITIIFANIFIYSYPLFWAANNQIVSQPYPASFQKAKEVFDQDKSDYQILILPWHMYVIGHSLTPKYTIVDPAPKYFYPSKIIACQDEEAGYVKNISPQQTAIRNLQNSTSSTVWLSFLRDAGIKYIFISKVTDTIKHGFDYDTFLEDKNFKKIVEDNYAVLFVNHEFLH